MATSPSARERTILAMTHRETDPAIGPSSNQSPRALPRIARHSGLGAGRPRVHGLDRSEELVRYDVPSPTVNATATADFDVIVIGSGPSGVQPAQAAVTRCAKIGLVDAGHVDDTDQDAVPDRPFAEIRRSEASQRRSFLGEQLEGARSDTHRIGVQLTPPRKHIARDTERYLTIDSETFAPLQSLALGGLGAGWDASTHDAPELRRAGLAPEPG
ncbi:MAG TPA: hypothetical protein DEQ98_14640 [Acidobacteria bacterium]|nr:hypothetical protein [Acidobacteriota bacterium]HCE04469.1 hypothetical protein [Acidobacteriota bacterium]